MVVAEHIDPRVIEFLDNIPDGTKALVTSRRTKVRVAVRPVDVGPLTRFAADTGLQFVKGSSLIDAELKTRIERWATEEGVDKPTAKKTNAWMKANGCREGRENYTKPDGKPSKRKIWKGASLPRPGTSPQKSDETQATIEEEPPVGRTGPTPPVNPPIGPRVEPNRKSGSTASPAPPRDRPYGPAEVPS